MRSLVHPCLKPCNYSTASPIASSIELCRKQLGRFGHIGDQAFRLPRLVALLAALLLVALFRLCGGCSLRLLGGLAVLREPFHFRLELYLARRDLFRKRRACARSQCCTGLS